MFFSRYLLHFLQKTTRKALSKLFNGSVNCSLKYRSVETVQFYFSGCQMVIRAAVHWDHASTCPLILLVIKFVYLVSVNSFLYCLISTLLYWYKITQCKALYFLLTSYKSVRKYVSMFWHTSDVDITLNFGWLLDIQNHSCLTLWFSFLEINFSWFYRG